MNKEIISDKQGASIVVLFIIGSSAMYIMGLGARQDLWIAIILALLISMPMALVAIRLHYIFPNKNLFDISKTCFGEFIGNIIIVLFTFFIFFWATDVLTNYGDFINLVSLPETPKMIPMIFIMLLCSFIVKEGIEVIGRCSEIFLMSSIFIILSSIILLIPERDINSIRPILSDNIKPIFKETFSILMFPFTQLAASFTIIFSNFKNNHSPYKIYIIGLFFGGILLLLNSLDAVLVLKVNASLTQYFPAYTATGEINIRDFLQRLEVVTAITFVLGGFIKISILLICICKGVCKVFGIDNHKFIVIPVALLIANLSYFQYESVMYYYEFASDIWPYFAFPFQIILPIIIWITAEIKHKYYY